MKRHHLPALFLVCLLFSGFSGLAYELIWVRRLALVFGSTTLSVSTLVGVFFGGLALGSALIGRWIHRVRDPLRFYVMIEAALAVLGPAIDSLIPSLSRLVAAYDPGEGPSGVGFRLLVSVPLLLVPTVLMGMTLPLALRVLSAFRASERTDDEVSQVYGVNTLGAFLGAYGVTYVFLPWGGMSFALAAAVVANLLAAAGGMVLGRRWPTLAASAGQKKKSGGSATSWSPEVGVAVGVAFLTGFSFIGAEIVWTRVYSILLKGSIYGVGAVLIAVLVGIGLGSLAAGRCIRRFSSGWSLVFAQMMGLGLLIFWSRSVLLTSYGLHTLSGVVQGASLSGGAFLHLQLLVIVGLIGPPAFFSGIAFSSLVVRVKELTGASLSDVALARVYTANTWGSISGSLVAGFYFLPQLGSETALWVLFVAAALSAALSAALLIESSQRRKGQWAALGSVLLLVFYSGFPSAEVSEASSTFGQDWNGFVGSLRSVKQSQIYFHEGQTANVAVRQTDWFSRSLSLNGLGQGSYQLITPHPVFESWLVAWVPLAHQDQPRESLVVGLGSGSTVDSLLRSQRGNVTVLELEDGVIEAADRIFRGKGPHRDPRVLTVVADARHFLAQARGGEKRYDLITSMPAHPWVAAPIFTREFFQLAHDSLSDDGVFSTWFGDSGIPNEAVGALFAAFTDVFRHYIVYRIDEAGAYFLVGSKGPLVLDFERLSRVHSLSGAEEFPQLASRFFLPRRVFASGNPSHPPVFSVRPNTDDLATVEVLAPLGTNVSADRSQELSQLFPRPYLGFEQARGFAWVDFAEELLGTPEQGRRSLLQWSPRLHALKEGLEGWGREGLSEGWREYFKGRLAWAEGRSAEALSVWSKASTRLSCEGRPKSGDVNLCERLTRWIDSEKNREERWLPLEDIQINSALQRGQYERADLAWGERVKPGGWAEWVRRHQKGLWLDRRPTEPRVLQALEVVLDSPQSSFSEEDRARIESRLWPLFPWVKESWFFSLCEERANRSGSEWRDLARACGERARALRQLRVQEAGAEALRLLGQKDDSRRGALAIVMSLRQSASMDRKTLLGLLEIVFRSGDRDSASGKRLESELRRDLSVLGMSGSDVDAFLQFLNSEGAG